jgi:hypothetical protein
MDNHLARMLQALIIYVYAWYSTLLYLESTTGTEYGVWSTGVEGADQRIMANFYKTILQSSLLYAAETCHLSNRHFRKMPNSNVWIYPNMAMAYTDLSMLSIPEYIHKRKTNLAYMPTRYTIDQYLYMQEI